MAASVAGSGVVPLTAEDRAILAMESATVVGHVCKVIATSSPLPVDALRTSLEGRVRALAPLSWRLSGSTDAPVWVTDPDLRIEDHVVDASDGAPVARAELNERIAGLFTQRLDRRRPLWRMDVLGPLENGGSVIVWRIHHALADGQTIMRFAAATLWDLDESTTSTTSSTSSQKSAVAAAELEHRRHRHRLAGFVEREFRREHGRSPFDGRISGQRAIAMATVPFRALRHAARTVADATVNDAVLACVAGGLRRWMAPRGQLSRELRVKVPVSMHQANDELGNRDSCFFLGLPVGAADPQARLRIIRDETVLRKENHDAEELDRVLEVLSRVSPRLRKLCERYQASPKEFALNVSNVPGPPSPVSVVGKPVRDLYAIADIGERHALRVGVISYHDELTFGLCADPTLVPDLEGLAAGIEAEAAELIELAR